MVARIRGSTDARRWSTARDIQNTARWWVPRRPPTTMSHFSTPTSWRNVRISNHMFHIFHTALHRHALITVLLSVGLFFIDNRLLSSFQYRTKLSMFARNQQNRTPIRKLCILFTFHFITKQRLPLKPLNVTRCAQFGGITRRKQSSWLDDSPSTSNNPQFLTG